MKQILITGLDGSGKSSVLAHLESFKKDKPFDIVYVPTIETTSLAGNQLLFKTTLFLNEMGHRADVSRNPQLKAIALFGSMLVYRKILEFKKNSDIDTIICERHPAIDTGIYARYYAAKMAPELLPIDLFCELEKKYPNEIKFLVGLVENREMESCTGLKYLSNVIYQKMYISQKTTPVELASFFKAEMPTQIFYLKATPEILFKRLSGRQLLEAHESLETLTQLSKAYDELWQTMADFKNITFEIINVNIPKKIESFKNLVIHSI